MLYTLAYRVEFFLDSTQLARKKIVLARVEKVSNHKICVRYSASKGMFSHLHGLKPTSKAWKANILRPI